MNSQKIIAIIGGGFSGTLTAYHLAVLQVQARIVLIDRQQAPGPGLAYSTPSHQHVLNVPAGKISALTDQPNHFVDWLQTNYEVSATEGDFVPRGVFGRYVQTFFPPAHAADYRQTSVAHAEAVVGLRDQPQIKLRLADDTVLLADAVVLATGNFDPAPLPGTSDEVVASGAYFHSAWNDAAYANLPPTAPVVLLGTGLAAVDALLRLRETGHQGTVIAISRHGVFPNRHARYRPLNDCVIQGEPPATMRELLHVVHAALKSGMDWRAVVDSLRARTNELWLALPLAEQQRFRRHLQWRWEVARHRMPPAVAEAIETELNMGTLVQHCGTIHLIVASFSGARIYFCQDGRDQEIDAARIINCTRPNMDYSQVGSPLLSSLLAEGVVVPGPDSIGLWTDQHGALKDMSGAFSETLFLLGPGRQGTLLESSAVPELRRQAKDLAELLAAKFC